MQIELTKEDRELVEAIFKKTGILTVKDKTTAKLMAAKTGETTLPYQKVRPYGEKYFAVTDDTVTPPNVDVNTQHMRTIIRELEGSPAFPDGIPIGGVEVYSRETPLDVPYGKKSFDAIGFKRDIAGGEFQQLRQMALGRVFLTDEMRKAREAETLKRRQGLKETQLDPAGKLADRIGEAIELLSKRQAKASEPSGAPAK